MSPLAFLLARSFRNSLAKKLRRLKEPRYVVSMLAFLGYLSMILFAGSHGKDAEPRNAREELAIASASACAFMLLSAAGPWLLPGRSIALAFSMAEIHLLFPAPIPRHALLRLKVLAAQPAIVVSALVFTLVLGRKVPALNAWAVLGGGWLALNALLLNRLLAQLSTVPLRPEGGTRVAWVVGRIVYGTIALGAAVSLRNVSLDAFSEGPGRALAAWASGAPARHALLPFATVAAPVLAQGPAEFARAAAPVLAILAALYALVVHRDVPFEEESLLASEKLKERLDVLRRTGRLGGPAKVPPAPIPLSRRGHPVLALAWKNYLSISRTPLWRVALYVALALGAAYAVTQVPSLRELHLGPNLASMAAAFAVMLVLLGPDFVRHDLRTSLLGVDFLKTLPLPGWAIVLGEMLAPAAVILFFQALLLGLASVLWVGSAEPPALAPRTWLAGWVAAVVFLGPMDLLLFTLANGAALVFPAWVPLGPRPQRGGEAFGANLLLQLARLVILLVGVAPAALIGAVAAFAGWGFVREGALPLGAAVGAFVLLVEVGGLVYVLGRVFERYDPSRENT